MYGVAAVAFERKLGSVMMQGHIKGAFTGVNVMRNQTKLVSNPPKKHVGCLQGAIVQMSLIRGHHLPIISVA